MLRTSMFFQMCSLSCGVFGFGSGAAPSWLLAKALFFVFFVVAVALLACGMVSRPANWKTLNRNLGAEF